MRVRGTAAPSSSWWTFATISSLKSKRTPAWSAANAKKCSPGSYSSARRTTPTASPAFRIHLKKVPISSFSQISPSETHNEKSGNSVKNWSCSISPTSKFTFTQTGRGGYLAASPQHDHPTQAKNRTGHTKFLLIN
jgi:hypothetical protein